MNSIGVKVLPTTIAPSAYVPFLIGSACLAASYGASFFLVDLAREGHHAETLAGAAVSTGTIATIACSLVAGRVAERIGIMDTVVISAGVLAFSMLSLAFVNEFVYCAYFGGLLMGVGWSAFYILAPLQVIRHVSGSARIKYLTLLSGSQMLGIGLAVPIGRWVAGLLHSFSQVYLLFALVCFVAVVLLKFAALRLRYEPQINLPATALNLRRVIAILRTPTALPIAMIGVGACIFSGLSTFQSIYAAAHRFAPDVFFLTFTATTVILRFAIAPLISKFRLNLLAGGLFFLTALGITLLYINNGSTAIYFAASFTFAAGYGLAYSTLNSMVIDLAEEYSVPLAIASQVFTQSYFVGIFGFPYFASQIINHFDFDALLVVMIGFVILNCLFLGLLVAIRQAN